MIRRYTLAEMGAIWSEQARFEHMLRVEIAVARAQVTRGLVPGEALPGAIETDVAALDILAEHRIGVALDQVFAEFFLIRQLTRHALGDFVGTVARAHQRPGQAKQEQRAEQAAAENPPRPLRLEQRIEGTRRFEYQRPHLAIEHGGSSLGKTRG